MKIYIEHAVGNDEYREDSYEIVEYGYEPYVSGRTSGPPERCYPPEGGFAEGGSPVLWRKNDENPPEEVAWDEFVQRYAAYCGHADEKGIAEAERDLCDQLYEWCIEKAEAAYEAAQEAKYDMMKDEGLI